MKKRDTEENKLISAYERGEFKPVMDQKNARRAAMEAAEGYMRKELSR